MLQGLLSEKGAGVQLIALVLIAYLGGVFFYALGLLILEPFAPISLIENIQKLTAFEEYPAMVGIYRSLLFFQHTGMFILPAIIYPYLLGKRWWSFLHFHGINLERIFFTFLIMFFFFPLSNYLGQLNAGLEMPESLGWLENKFEAWEEQARSLTQALLGAESWIGLLRNLFLLALLPALGEEMLFRGAVQRSLASWSKNTHLAIWVTAILFSAMHMQFYGFLPRLALGALFGYLLVWTGTLWVPILGHFLNNATAVLGNYFLSKEGLEEKIENAGGQEGQTFFVLLTALVVGGLLYYASRKFEGIEKS